MKGKTISIIGLGSIGSHLAARMAKQGPHLRLIDFDVVEEKNLAVQNYSQQDLGKPKVTAVSNRLKKLHPKISIQQYEEKLTPHNTHLLCSDLVIDCTDNLTVRFLINDACYQKIPWLHTAASRDTGVVYAVSPGKPCFSCLYPKNLDGESCIQRGISRAAAKKIASLTAEQALKILNNQQPEENLIRLNTKTKMQEKIKIIRRCPRCLDASSRPFFRRAFEEKPREKRETPRKENGKSIYRTE